MSKFSLGVLGSVITALVGFFLIGPGGLLNPKPAKLGPRARVTAFNGPGYSSVGQVPARSFTIYNGGDTAAERCVIFWNPFGPDTKVFDAIQSAEFILTPGQAREITLVASKGYSKAEVFDEGAAIYCNGEDERGREDDYHSPTATRVVNTFGPQD